MKNVAGFFFGGGDFVIGGGIFLRRVFEVREVCTYVFVFTLNRFFLPNDISAPSVRAATSSLKNALCQVLSDFRAYQAYSRMHRVFSLAAHTALVHSSKQLRRTRLSSPTRLSLLTAAAAAAAASRNTR